MSSNTKLELQMATCLSSSRQYSSMVEVAIALPLGVPCAESTFKPNPHKSSEDAASGFSRFFVTYLDPLFAHAYRNELNHSDLGLVSQQDKACFLFDKFEKKYNEEAKKPLDKQSLWHVLWGTVGYCRLVNALILYGLYAALSYGPVLILNYLTKHLQGTEVLSDVGLGVCVSLMLILPVLGSVFTAQSNIILAHIGLQFRNVLITKIYRKSLKLSAASRQDLSTGMIVNMFSNDTAQLQRFLFFLNNCSLAPAQIAVALALIYQQVGPATFVGLAFMFILIPVNVLIFGYLNTVRKKKVTVSDMRVKLMNEVLNGVRIIKQYAWESAFEQKLTGIRMKELYLLKEIAYVIAVGFTLILFSAPIVQPILIFYTYVRLGYTLDAATAFTTIALFNLLQMPFAFLPMGLAQFSQSLVSTQRMLKYFAYEEIEDYVHKEAAADGTVISFDNVNMGWVLENKMAEAAASPATAPTSATAKSVEMVPATTTSTPDAPADAPLLNRSVHTLTDMSLSIKKGQLVAVVGNVGSGKSSILGGMLGELNLLSGLVRVSGSIAYCDQRPWILNATVKENILFGLDYDEDRFQRALYAANLKDDIAVLPGGVMTEIGERGINLSGGQKARVAIARAVYRDTDIYLLDDPLSAVDAHVGNHLFHNCIKGELAKKTVVLVTHAVHMLPHCDKVVILSDGKILAQGTYDELTRSGLDITEFVPKEVAGEKPVNAEDEKASSSSSTKDSAKDTSVASDKDEKSPAATENVVRDNSKKEKKIMTVEERNTGDVALSAYSYYIKAGGTWLFVLMLLFNIFSQVFSLLSAFYLAYWGAQTVKQENGWNGPMSGETSLTYLNTYAWICMIGVFLVTGRSLLLANHRLGTSSLLHEQLLSRTLGAPISFFDVTPVGRILNRFSSDMNTIDEELSQTISQVLNSIFACLGSIGAIAGATKGTFLILLIPLMYFYTRVQSYFRKTNTTVARLESVSRSPIYADFSQALGGISSIRAYKDAHRFILHLESQLDNNSIAAITAQLAGQWLAIRLDALGASISFFVALIAVTSDGFIPAGFMAIGLLYSFQLITFLKFAVRMSATGEAQMNSVERIKYYIDNVPQEFTKDPIENIPEDWPSSGNIVATNVKLRYRDGPLVLKGLNFDVKAGDKVGIAGRTGSGKSSMMVALFRVEELVEGSLVIDGLDISRVPLHTIRSRIGIIPQDPVMFSSSVRFNLDPFDRYSDAEVWAALDQVEMKSHVMSLPNKLGEEVAEGGDNFSAGQRQLICIARAILRKPKIVVLDEATASIDNTTDELIQKAIRKQYTNSSVLTIAHRIHTIMDSTKIMVLDNGFLAEFDTPANLLKNEEGIFSSLWKKHLKAHSGSGSNLAALVESNQV